MDRNLRTVYNRHTKIRFNKSDELEIKRTNIFILTVKRMS